MRAKLVVAILMGLGIAAAGGFAVGVHSQTSSFNSFAEEKIGISRMDWILLRARVEMLEQSLKDDLDVAIVPASYAYNPQEEKIKISVYVSPVWLIKSNAAHVKDTLSRRAALLCVAPVTADVPQPAPEGTQIRPSYPNYLQSFYSKALQQSCQVRFFSPNLMDKSGLTQQKEVASFEAGKFKMNPNWSLVPGGGN